MPWVRFIADFDFKPRASVTVAFKEGSTTIVTRAAAAKAIEAGKAVPAGRQTRGQANGTK